MPLILGAESTAEVHPILVDSSGRLIPTYREEQGAVKVATTYSGGSIGPHALTTRFTYTVPAATKARVEASYAFISRASAPSSTGRVLARLTYTPSGGSAVVYLRVQFNEITVGKTESQSLAYGLLLLAGDKIIAETADAATGGAVDYELSVIVTEMTA